METRETLELTIEELESENQELREALAEIIANWEKGDLAGAVNNAECLLESSEPIKCRFCGQPSECGECDKCTKIGRETLRPIMTVPPTW